VSMRRVVVLVATALVVTTALAGPATAARSKLKLSSPAFANGRAIPSGFTCDGQSASPPLRWKGVPKRTVELAITVEDPDTPIGTFVHWVAWGIDPKAGHLPEQTIPSTVHQGKNGAGGNKYLGPCPPSGNHHYIFTLYALSKPVTLSSDAGIKDLRAAIKGTVLATAKLVGRYQHPNAA
jgi:Raf kinase inhibitor-like YbhB/YbcL family protein